MRNYLILMILIGSVSGCGKAEQPAVQSPSAGEEQTSQAIMIDLPEDEDMNEAGKPIVFEIPALGYDGYVAISEGIYVVYDEEHYSYFSEAGKQIGSDFYDMAAPFREGLACVRQNGKYGFIDTDGNVAIPFTYDKANSFSDGRAYFESGDRYGYLDTNGDEVIVLDCDSASFFQEGMAYISIDGKYGYINTDGEVVIPLIYDDVSCFENGMATVRAGGQIGVINQLGTEVVPIRYDMIQMDTGIITASRNGINYGYDYRGKLLIEGYEHAGSDDFSHFIKYRQNGKWGLINRQGELVVEPEYDWIEIRPQSNIICFNQEGKKWLVSESGEMLTSQKYDDIYLHPAGRVAKVQNGERFGLLSLDDYSEVTPVMYDGFSSATDNHIFFKLNGEQGVMDSVGTVVVSSRSQEIRLFANDYMALAKADKYCLAGPDGEPLTDYEYDEIKKSGDWFMVKKRGYFGFVNQNGDEIISPQYQSVDTRQIYGVAGTTETCYIGKGNQDFDYLIRINGVDYFGGDDLIMKNEITPRLKEFHDFSNSYEIEDGEAAYAVPATYVTRAKLLSVTGSGEPLLYMSAWPAKRGGYASGSGFYSLSEGNVKALLTGYDCGGSMGGDQVYLYKDMESSDLIIGTDGHYGGFGGSAGYYERYRYKENKAELICSYGRLQQPVKYYNESTLAERADLLYDQYGNTYSEATMTEEERVAEHTVNERTVTKEEYEQKEGNFQYIPVLR